MKSFFCALFLCFAAGCGSSTGQGTGTGTGSSGTDGVSSGTTLACVVTITSPECQLYEATGADASRAIDSLRAQCVDQAGITAMVVDACPTQSVLGGCKSPVKVEGDTNVQLFVTNFFYPASDSSPALGPTSESAVEEQCASDGSTFVASP